MARPYPPVRKARSGYTPAKVRGSTMNAVVDAKTLVITGEESTEVVEDQYGAIKYSSSKNDGRMVWLPYPVRNFIYGNAENVHGMFSTKLFHLNEIGYDDSFRQALERQNSVPIAHILQYFSALQELDKDTITGLGLYYAPQFMEFMNILTAAQIEIETKLDDETSEVNFRELIIILNSKNRLFSLTQSGETIVFGTKTARYIESPYGDYIRIMGKVTINIGPGFQLSTYDGRIPVYEGNKSLAQVGLSLIDIHSPQYIRFLERGRLAGSYMSRPEYVSYVGSQSFKTDNGTRKFPATGRIVIDVLAMKTQIPAYDKYFGVDWESDNEGIDRVSYEALPDSAFVTMSPFLYGFSFASKEWGEFYVENVNDITFREDAYENLVMDSFRKDLMFGLVDTDMDSTSDFIDGKGGGLIFLLSGEPGVGKTFTAEAIAEKLQRPLYTIGVGELGTNVSTLEKKLTEILNMVQTWKAVLLIDECDIFLEKRTSDDIERNAMVGVFLRKLEYYSGVLFLTTNRANNIDSAFDSRISLKLHYDALDEATRKSVWTKVLRLNGLTEKDVDINLLAAHPTNGRQIKNVTRVATAYAKFQKRQLRTEDFSQIIQLSEDFYQQVAHG